jgi:hypothetical protein
MQAMQSDTVRDARARAGKAGSVNGGVEGPQRPFPRRGGTRMEKNVSRDEGETATRIPPGKRWPARPTPPRQPSREPG